VSHRVCVEELAGGYEPAIRKAFQTVGALSTLKPGARVFIKPNLTFPVYRPGVMTNPECVEALVRVLKDHTTHITIGEADSGGYNRFSMDEVLARTGIKGLERKYGIRVVNLCHLPARTIRFDCRGRGMDLPLPQLLLDETDLVISTAVPKIHMNTLVSMTVKNLWGCIPEPPVRLRLHPYLGRVLFEIVRQLKQAIGVVDGQYGLNRSGPMLGVPVNLGWLMVADDLYAADVAGCQLMQVDPRRVRHLSDTGHADYRMPSLGDIEFNRDLRPFLKEQFYLKRKWTDLPGGWAFRSPALSYLAYFSPLSGFLHRILYLFRKPFYNYNDPGKTEDDHG